MQKEAYVVMITRTSGIIMGVALTLFFTITILPSSAHNSIDRNLLVAMRELFSLHCLCWLPITETELFRPHEGDFEGSRCAQHLKGWQLEDIRSKVTAGCFDEKGKVKTSENSTVAVSAASAPSYH